MDIASDVRHDHNNVAGIPLTILSEVLMEKYGQHLVIIFTFFIYSIRLYGYSVSSNINQILSLEVLKPFGNPLSMIAALHFIRQHAQYHNMASLEVGYIHTGVFTISFFSGLVWIFLFWCWQGVWGGAGRNIIQIFWVQNSFSDIICLMYYPPNSYILFQEFLPQEENRFEPV